MVAREAGVGGMVGELVDAAGIDDERPRAVDEVGQHRPDRQRRRRTGGRRDGDATRAVARRARQQREQRQQRAGEQQL